MPGAGEFTFKKPTLIFLDVSFAPIPHQNRQPWLGRKLSPFCGKAVKEHFCEKWVLRQAQDEAGF